MGRPEVTASIGQEIATGAVEGTGHRPEGLKPVPPQESGMLGGILSLLWWLIKLPIKLILLPYKIVSTIISIVFYAVVLLLIGGVIYYFVFF